jgi:Protein of unknown function (DUF3887)
VDPLEFVRAARDVRDRAEAFTAAAVEQARDAGRTWQEIGEVLGMPHQTAFQRYGNLRPLPEADDLAKTAIDDLSHGRWSDVSARFDATMRERLTDDELAHGWAQIVKSAGAYQNRAGTEAVRTGDFTVTNTPLTFEAGGIVARITFRDDQTIAGLYLLDPDAARSM